MSDDDETKGPLTLRFIQGDTAQNDIVTDVVVAVATTFTRVEDETVRDDAVVSYHAHRSTQPHDIMRAWHILGEFMVAQGFEGPGLAVVRRSITELHAVLESADAIEPGRGAERSDPIEAPGTSGRRRN